MLISTAQSGHEVSDKQEGISGGKLEASAKARIQTATRQRQYKYIAKALDNTKPPVIEEERTGFIPTTIEFSGPGNYGRKEYEDGKEVVLLNDDVLTSVANATVVAVDGNDQERVSVLYQLPQFLEHCSDECINILVPQICAEAVGWSTESQVAATEALYFVVNKKIPNDVSQKIVYTVLEMTSNQPSIEVFDACGEILSMILPQVHRFDVLQSVVPCAVDKSTSDEAAQRKLAARLLGSLNDALTAVELEKIFGNTMYDLAHDPDDSVRAMISQSMAAIGEKLPLRSIEQKVSPILQKLYVDNCHQVSVASLKAIARTAEAHRSDSKDSVLYQTFFKDTFISECKIAADVASTDLRTVEDNTYVHLEMFAEIYGRFLYAVDGFLDDDDTWTEVLNTLRLMVTCNGPTVRHWSSYNMPAIACVCSDSKADRLTGVITALAGDSDVEARSTLAAGIHEITRFLYHGPLAEDVIKTIAMLFADDNSQVRMNALSHFSELVSLVSPGADAIYARVKAQMALREKNVNGESNPEDNIPEEDLFKKFSPMFSALELMSFDSWRTQELLAQQIQKCANLIPQDMLCEHIAPLLFHMSRESTSLVRKASMLALVHVIRSIPEVKRRNHIMKHFKTEWARGKVFWTRLAFIDGAELASNVFSHSLFTKLFKNELLAMKNDSVANVRHRLIRVMVNMIPIWKEDTTFIDTMRRLASDSDDDVSSTARQGLIKIRTGSGLSQEEIEKDKELESIEARYFIVGEGKKRKSQVVVHPQINLDQPESQGNDIAVEMTENQVQQTTVLKPENNAPDSKHFVPIAQPLDEKKKLWLSTKVSSEKSKHDGSEKNGDDFVLKPSKSSSGTTSDQEKPATKKASFFTRLFTICFKSK